jgi:hypothetical protein
MRARDASLVHCAVLTAVEAGAAHGIDASDESNNTVVWLRPSPVVAKVATRADAKLDLRLEHAVATELAALVTYVGRA